MKRLILFFFLAPLLCLAQPPSVSPAFARTVNSGGTNTIVGGRIVMLRGGGLPIPRAVQYPSPPPTTHTPIPVVPYRQQIPIRQQPFPVTPQPIIVESVRTERNGVRYTQTTIRR